MSLLLDTCVFLWLIGLPERLSPAARGLLTQGDTRITVSTANLWEVLIKLGKGQIGLDSGGARSLRPSADLPGHRARADLGHTRPTDPALPHQDVLVEIASSCGFNPCGEGQAVETLGAALWIIARLRP